MKHKSDDITEIIYGFLINIMTQRWRINSIPFTKTCKNKPEDVPFYSKNQWFD